jgi:hypothetical protein
VVEPQPDLVLVHGLFAPDRGPLSAAREQRAGAFGEHGPALGVFSYEWVDGHRRAIANRMLRRMRGTARAVDAVEIIALDEDVVRASLATGPGREHWRQTAGCKPFGLDAANSFILIGAPRQLLQGPRNGQRVLWFGNGLGQLSTEEFVAHYTTGHGPLVASHAREIGLRSYRQVPAERDDLCESLRALGMGAAPAPAVFAELVMGAPPLSLGGLVARRAATREITADEKRHIDFSRSMLLLT